MNPSPQHCWVPFSLLPCSCSFSSHLRRGEAGPWRRQVPARGITIKSLMIA
jgi:hypothetical protein